MNHKSFSDILKKINIDEKKFIETEEKERVYLNYTLQKSILLDKLTISKKQEMPTEILLAIESKIEELELKIEELIEFHLLFENFTKEINKCYTNIIFNEEYFLSVEDIMKDLDISMSYFEQIIKPKLDRIDLPPAKYLSKKELKYYINEINYRTLLNNVIGCQDKITIPRKTIQILLRKRVLYSIDSYKRFLDKHLTLIASSVGVNILFDKEEGDKLVELFRIKKNCDDINLSLQEKLRKYFYKHRSKIIDNTISKETFDYDNYVDRHFNIVSNEYVSSKLGFKSRRFLKTIFDVVYEIEVDRIIDRHSVHTSIFELDHASKKPRKRFMLSSEFIKERFQESFGAEFTDYDDDEYLVNIKLPTNTYIEHYKSNSELLKNDILNLISNKFQSKK